MKRTTPGVNLYRSRLHPFRSGLLVCGFALATLAVPGVGAQILDQQQPTSDTPSSATLPSPANSSIGNLLNQLSPQTGTGQTDEQGRMMREAERRELQASQNQPPLPPEPPSPFQRMVEATTGEKLEIYGASLFRRVPTTFAPVQNVPVGPSYVVGPGDELVLQLAGQVNRQMRVTVDREGAIQLPELGTVHVAGLTYADLPGFLNRQLGRIYRNFTLSVSMGALRTIQVFVVGEARRPGSFSVSSLSTLLNALFASGGPSATGSVRDIQVKRNGQTIDHFDLYDLLLRGDKSKDIPLATGDVIFIPFAGPQVAVLGSVNHPAIYELKGQTSVSQALEFAGGETALASGADVLLERVYEHENRNVENVSQDQSKTEMMQGGDILSVRAVVDRFRNAVTLRGNVANPGRYAWHPGMKVSELIPNRESLVTREYWRNRNELGQFVLDQSEEPQEERRQRQLQQRIQQQQELQQLGLTPQMQIRGQQVPGAQGQGTQGANQQYPNQTATPQMYDEQGLPVQGAEAAAQQQMQGAANNQGYQQTQGGTVSSTSGGGSAAGALIGGTARFEPKNHVLLSAPDIDWGYAVIERQDAKTLTSSLIPFNLGKLVLDGDGSQDVELLPGDVVTIFSKADIRVPTQQQTRYVRLEGEFVAAGVYSVQPGETLRSLVRRAGGFTPDAYLYASEFSRESTRRLQQQRLLEYADELDAQLSLSAVTNPALTPQDQQSQLASQTAVRAAVARLRRIQPIGRIVLELKPDSTGIDSLPDIALEDGDRFVVPRLPSNVTVEGQVYSANAFLYMPGKRAKAYLHEAGGPDRQADHKRMFILRADGSVVSQQYSDVDKAMIYPGDTIVVPPYLQPKNALQRTMNIAQIAGNLALSVAAIAVLAKQ
ncbi:MAG TPA: SLBB domain-containing protein [Acidobacteriaceae bacterium]|nr:SLBB domain-containing protein [Acidobacteriaceae bacterium]